MKRLNEKNTPILEIEIPKEKKNHLPNLKNQFKTLLTIRLNQTHLLISEIIIPQVKKHLPNLKSCFQNNPNKNIESESFTNKK